MHALALLLLSAVSPSATQSVPVVLTDEIMIGTWDCGPTTMHGPKFDIVVSSRTTNRPDHTATTVTTSIITPHGAPPITNIDEATETWAIDGDLVTRIVSKIRFISSTDPRITPEIGQQIVDDQVARKSVYQSRILGIKGRVLRSIPFNATQKQAEVESTCSRRIRRKGDES